MTGWELVRFLHLAALAFFVGGQIMLVAVVTPAVRRHGTDAAMRSVARRFGMGTLIALAVLIASGAAMASHFDLWDDPTLQAKLGVLVLVGVLIGLHIASPETRGISLAMLAASLLIVWLGVKLVYG